MSVPAKTSGLLNLPGITHGFFGRKGGVSDGTYDSLNAGLGSDDEPENVVENRKRIAAALGTTNDNLLSLWQIHSREVMIVDKPYNLSKRPKADGLVTKTPGLALSALSADCGPVLLADPDAKVIGACHAGWRGAFSGITDETINAMEAIGANRESIRAVLGPCISQENYEVGPEFRDSFVAENEAHDRFFKQGTNGRPHFDLKRFILAKLRNAGVTRIEALPDCTYGEPESYFSYRYNTHQDISGYGRNISAICLSE